MKTVIIFVASIGLSLTIPTPGLRFKNLYKPATGAHYAQKPRIIGGEEAVPHSRPFQAFLEVHDATGGGWYCGGNVVSNNYLLTAGHCGDGGLEAIITLGAHEITNPRESTQVRVTTSSITVHPDFDYEEILNDISAFGFEEPIEYNENIQPVALPGRGDSSNDFVGETATLTGWGVTEAGLSDALSPVLKTLDSPIVPNSQCEHESNWDIPDMQICVSGSSGTSSCRGDSGGPVTVVQNAEPVLVGIISYGVEFCLSGYPSVFTRVTSFLDWIEANTDVVFN